jgi:hypothetical protein
MREGERERESRRDDDLESGEKSSDDKENIGGGRGGTHDGGYLN